MNALKPIVLGSCTLLFAAVVALAIIAPEAAANHQCCDPEQCDLVTSPTSIVSDDETFSFTLLFEHCTPDEPFLGAVEAVPESSTNVSFEENEEPQYDPAYFFPDGCHSLTSIDVSGSKVEPGEATLVSTAFVWDSGSPPIFCEDDETTNIP